jgi:hypothetical protein
VDELASSMLATSAICSTACPSPTGSTNYKGWAPLVDASSKLIALVRNPTGTGGPVDAYTVSQNINASSVRQDATSGIYYLDRNYKINNSTATNVEVQFFFLNSELTALQGVDAGVTLANLGVTRQTGSTCYNNFSTSNGTNSYLPQSGNGTVNGVSWVKVTTPSFSNFYLFTSKAQLSVKAFLQGSYNASVTRHKDVTSGWASILNTNALSQPYNIAAFGNYGGTESVSSGFFASNSGSTTDITDWILLELRDATTPSTIIARRAAFIREDGQIVDIDGTSDVIFRGVTAASYYVTIRHRNHLGIRSASAQSVNGSLGNNSATTYDFTTAQSQAYQNGSITSNDAMAVNGSVYLMWGGNINPSVNTTVSYTGLNNDAVALLAILGGNQGAVITSVYSVGDINMNGTVSFSGLNNDQVFLISVLGGNQGAMRRQHL